MDKPQANGNGRTTRTLLQIVLTLALLAYSAVLTVKEVVAKNADPVATTTVNERVARIEATLEAVQGTVTRIERKVDDHMAQR